MFGFPSIFVAHVFFILYKCVFNVYDSLLDTVSFRFPYLLSAQLFWTNIFKSKYHTFSGFVHSSYKTNHYTLNRVSSFTMVYSFHSDQQADFIKHRIWWLSNNLSPVKNIPFFRMKKRNCRECVLVFLHIDIKYWNEHWSK